MLSRPEVITIINSKLFCFAQFWKVEMDGPYLKTVITRQVPSMIHLATPTVSPVVNIVFAWNLFYFARFWKVGTYICTDNIVKTMITTGRDWGSAEWINWRPWLCDCWVDQYKGKSIFLVILNVKALDTWKHLCVYSSMQLTDNKTNTFISLSASFQTTRQTGLLYQLSSNELKFIVPITSCLLLLFWCCVQCNWSTRRTHSQGR